MPASGSSQSIPSALKALAPIRTTCPDTYADFGDRQNRSVESSCDSAFAPT